MKGYRLKFNSENKEIANKWNKTEWEDLYNVSIVPLIGDIIDLEGLMTKASTYIMLDDFGTTNFEVKQRRLIYDVDVAKESEFGCWSLYILTLEPCI